jgi:hypothetical protein
LYGTWYQESFAPDDTWDFAAAAQDYQAPFARIGRMLNGEPALNGDDDEHL